MSRVINKLTQRIVSLFVALLMIGLQTAVAPVVYADSDNQNDNENKISICHRTASHTNPYVKISVDQSAADGIAGNSGNEADHFGEHQGPIFYPSIPKHNEWGDIIPPINDVHSGANWTDEGQSIWNNDCKLAGGSITIVKDAQPNSAQDFSFVTSGEGLINFTLDDDNDNTLPNTKTFSELSGGDYTINENKANGWILKNLVCSDVADTENSDMGVTIHLSAGQNVTCTFTNQRRGRVYVTKVTEPTDTSTTFGLNITGDGNIVNPTSKTIKGGQTVNWEVDQGTYSVTEAPKDGWTTKSNTCVDLQVTADDLNQYCTITNVKNPNKGKISVVKNVDTNGDGQADIFNVENWQWDINGGISRHTGAGNKVEVTAGEYTVNEHQKDGYHVIASNCSNGDDEDKTWSEPSTSQNVEVNSGSNVVCTFTNSRDKGEIKGHKFNDLNSSGVRDENESTISHWKITLYSCDNQEEENNDFPGLMSGGDSVIETLKKCDHQVGTDWTNGSGEYNFYNLLSGKYKVCEEQRDFWTQTFPANISGCHEVTINEDGQVVAADFGNHHNVNLDITKTNDTTGSVHAGDTVTYTVKVSVPETSDTVYDATAVDVLPSGFTYISGSWTGTDTEPTYGTGSEGTWSLGNINPGETITLTYKVKIGSAVTPGTYNNVVIASGFDGPNCNNEEVEIPQLLSRENSYCQQQCNSVTSPYAKSSVTVIVDPAISTFTPGQVLGASTELANTGGSQQPLQLILPILMILGTAILAIATRRRQVSAGTNL